MGPSLPSPVDRVDDSQEISFVEKVFKDIDVCVI